MDAPVVDQPICREKTCPVRAIGRAAKRYWFVIVAFIAVAEFGAWLWQTRPTMQTKQWGEIRRLLENKLTANDLVLMYPSWIDPIGRMHLGDDIMTEQRVARADESRFARAFEVSWRGHRSPDTANWRVKNETLFGALQVRELENPQHVPVINDLVQMFTPAQAQASIAKTVDDKDIANSGNIDPSQQAEPCNWNQVKPMTGPLGFGPAAPAVRALCPSGVWVGVTINADMDYRPRKCIYAPPPGSGEAIRLQFASVQFGHSLQGHHALYVEAERDGKGVPVEIVFATPKGRIGRAVHHDGAGWTKFSFDTTQLQGQIEPLQVTISAANGHRRMYCFEATTR